MEISAEDRKDFIEDIIEDLKEINPQRIAGLGITADQLDDWLKER